MGPSSVIISLLLLLLSIYDASATKSNSNSTDCVLACRSCDSIYIKENCSKYCPPSSNYHNCQRKPKYSELVIGVSVGVVLCIVLAMGGLLCVRFRRKKHRKERMPKHTSKELKKFHRELDRLRPHAYTFLAILNNIRRHVREMHRAGNSDAAVMCGRSLSDLAKILVLLNRQDIPIIPPEWPRLLSWAERLLERNALMNHQTQIQVGPLIQFLQTPTPKPRQFVDNNSTPMSTLKPPAYEDFIAMQDQSQSEFNYGRMEWTQQWEFPSISETEMQSDAWQSRTQVVQENLWIDDDFRVMSTFRPQDEIVTVL